MKYNHFFFLLVSLQCRALGDGAYVGDPRFLAPFPIDEMNPEHGLSNADKIYFNYRLRQVRVLPEHSFAWLKDWWLVLSGRVRFERERIASVVRAAVLLSNFIMIKRNSFPISDFDPSKYPIQPDDNLL